MKCVLRSNEIWQFGTLDYQILKQKIKAIDPWIWSWNLLIKPLLKKNQDKLMAKIMQEFIFPFLCRNQSLSCTFVFVYLGFTILIIAVESNYPNIELLLQNGADVNAKTDTG